jgi:hypothetical protein
MIFGLGNVSIFAVVLDDGGVVGAAKAAGAEVIAKISPKVT